MSTTEAQRRADKKYKAKNKEKTKYIQYKSRAKSFINNLATNEDLEEIKLMIEEKLK